MKQLLYALIVVAMMLPIGVEAQNEEKEQNKNVMNKITAKELYDAFRTDSDVAAKKYRLKRMQISGVAVKVGPDVYGLPSVEVASKAGESCKALCVLPFSDYLKLRKVSKTDSVVMEGEVRGYSEEYDLVVVKQCKIFSVNGKEL